MKTLISIFLTLFLFQGPSQPLEQVFPIRFKENIQLKGYEEVRKTFKYSENEMFLIAKRNFETGYQLLYLKRPKGEEVFRKSFVSNDKGEAYVYCPYFYKVTETEFIVIAEEGYEYMSGIDVFLLKDGNMKFLGYVPVAGIERDSVVPSLRIERNSSGYDMRFKGTIEHEIATDRLIDGANLKVHFTVDEFTFKEN